MRPQQNRRIRGRGNNNNNNNNRNRGGPNPLTRNYESNGPDVKIRGNAQHIADKYTTLARDAQASGDRIMAENYLQHAEHYMRIILSAQPQMLQTLRDEATYDNEANTNVVDLPVVIAGMEETSSEELPQLALTQEEGKDIQAITAHDEPAREQPAIDKPRRITRRRLPRQIAATGQTAPLPDMTDSTDRADSMDNTTSESSASVPVKRVRMAKPVMTAVDKPSSPSPETEIVPISTSTDDAVVVEKPRRRRRVLKTDSEVVQAS